MIQEVIEPAESRSEPLIEQLGGRTSDWKVREEIRNRDQLAGLLLVNALKFIVVCEFCPDLTKNCTVESQVCVEEEFSNPEI